MIWFKNVLFYALNRDVLPAAETLETQLAAQRFTPCAHLDMQAIGWTSPLPVKEGDAALSHAANGHILLCARMEEKLLPAAVVKQKWQEQIAAREAEQGKKLSGSEKASLKDEIIHTLLPRAFSRFSQIYVWIDSRKQRIMVDTASRKKAETVLALLRKTLGSLPVTPFSGTPPLEVTLTRWLRSGDLPAGLTLQDEAELQALPEGEGILRCKKQDLQQDEIRAHLEAGKQVTQLALDWQEQIQCVLTHEGALKRLKWAEALRNENDDIRKEDAAQRFDADFALMTAALSDLIDLLLDTLCAAPQHAEQAEALPA